MSRGKGKGKRKAIKTVKRGNKGGRKNPAFDQFSQGMADSVLHHAAAFALGTAILDLLDPPHAKGVPQPSSGHETP